MVGSLGKITLGMFQGIFEKQSSLEKRGASDVTKPEEGERMSANVLLYSCYTVTQEELAKVILYNYMKKGEFTLYGL